MTIYDANGNEISSSSPLKNQKCGILGDSVTFGVGASSPEKCYANLLSNEFKSLENKGLSGSPISTQPHFPLSFVTRYNTMANDLDVVIVFGGINDFKANAAIGESTSTDGSTFCGALNTIFKGLQKKYVGKEIFVVAPYQIYGAKTPNTQGKTLQDYVDALKERCNFYSIPCLDLLADSGMGNDATFEQRFTYLSDSDTTPNTIHPSDVGHYRIYKRILGFLMEKMGV